jgi:2'-5' RNA ligase
MHELVRCFLAIDIENHAALKKIVEIQKTLRNTDAHIKFVKPENIHITMKFLGNVPLNLINRISNKLQKVEFDTFQAKLKGLGVFPRLAYPRIVWIGITNGSDNLRRIFNQIESILGKLGFQQEMKGFSPHITIARVKSLKNKTKLIDLIKNKSEYDIGEIQINSLKLKKSELTAKGPIYSTINQFRSNNEALK